MRTTFGPTRRSIEEFLTAFSADPQTGLEAQIESPPTLHRAFWRRRANPRIYDGISTMAGVAQSACANFSRWNRFAFSNDDDESNINITSAGPGALALSVRGQLRTVVNASLFESAGLNPPEPNRTYSNVHGDGTVYARSMVDTGDAWLAPRFPNLTFRADEWMLMDLGAVLDVGGVVTQGRKDADWHFATNFSIFASSDNQSFNSVPGNFTNAHGNTQTHSMFQASVSARYVKFVIRDWHGWPALRAAVVVNGV